MRRALLTLTFLLVCASYVLAQDNLRFGDPGCRGNDREFVDHRYLALCESDTLHVPLWVAYELTKADLNARVPRLAAFSSDPDLRQPGARPADYHNSGYSEGHMAPAEDFRHAQAAERVTFYLSNVVPQKQRVNAGKWKALENRVRKITKKAGTAYIITGPIFANQHPATIGDDHVAVPTHTFKAILSIDKNGTKAVYAVIMPNTDKVNGDVNDYATTVNEIERQTGLNLFSKLNPTEQQQLERTKALFPN